MARTRGERADAFDHGAPDDAAEEAASPIGYIAVEQVNDMVTAAVAAATASIMQQVRSEREKAGAETAAEPGDEMKFARAIALAMAEVADQGTSRKRVAPEVLRARAEANDRMFQLIIECHAHGDIPAYRLKHKTYLPGGREGERLVDPVWVNPATHMHEPTEIDWPGVPNEAMVPINPAADRIFAAWSQSIGSVPRIVDHDILKVTAGGLVVKQGGRVITGEAPQVGHGQEDHGGMKIRGRGGPGRIVQTSVLGTIAPAARETH